MILASGGEILSACADRDMFEISILSSQIFPSDIFKERSRLSRGKGSFSAEGSTTTAWQRILIASARSCSAACSRLRCICLVATGHSSVLFIVAVNRAVAIGTEELPAGTVLFWRELHFCGIRPQSAPAHYVGIPEPVFTRSRHSCFNGVEHAQFLTAFLAR
ncbi:hypothetical protein BV898_04710 [Hypsibius exemplaris]|uniref:Uncharacterized protein n=1 Tax=Hypsibius exemplaris TaxID=2072580 RepID=A0A1W0X1A2_HYPEX|nr:hypothetical protein BV898_04710 [Hypsibius exemplaris]